MSRKLQKGYFVRGQFVAQGSQRDLELKRAFKGETERSKTDLKRESEQLQKLGTDLLGLRSDLLERLQLPEKLADAIAEANRISDFEGKRRQLQFIGKLMRKLDAATLLAARAALAEQQAPSAHEALALHRAQDWRERLLCDDAALDLWLALYPDTDIRALRALLRQARKDALPGAPGAAQRHGRAYRDIFQTIKAALSAPDEAEHGSQRPARPDR